MPSNHEISRAYKAGQDYAVQGPTETNCHFSIFTSPEASKMWSAGNADQIEQLLIEQANIDNAGK